MKGEILRYKHIEAHLCWNIEIKDRLIALFSTRPVCWNLFLYFPCLSCLKLILGFFFSYYYIVLHLLIHFVDLDILVLFFYIWILKLTPVLTKLVLVPHDNQVFDITSLLIFTPHELDYLLCGRRELWEVIFSYLCIYALRDVIGTSFVECDGYTLIFNFCRLIHLLII